MPRNTNINLRRGLAVDWQTTNPILDLGEPGYDITNNKLKIGDGNTPWNLLPYFNVPIGTCEDNSVVILTPSGNLCTDEIDSRVWGSSLVDGAGTSNYVSKWSDSDTLTSGIIYDDGTNVGIGTSSPSSKLDVSGVITAIGGNSSQWNTAYDWGDHSAAGYTTISKRYSITSTSNTFASFTTAESYIVGEIDIFQNGIKLYDGTDFTATDGSSVTLTNYAPSGSIIEYIINMSSGVYQPVRASITASITNKIYDNISIQTVSATQTPSAGDSFTYTWTITNNNTETASNLKVLGDYPTNINITRATALNSYTTTSLTLNDKIVWIIPTLQPGPWIYEIAVFNAQATSNTNSLNSPSTVLHNDIWNADLTVNTIASSYRWQLSTDNGVSWSNIDGATSQTVNLIDLTTADNNNKYRVITINNGLTAISETITLQLQ